MPQDSKIGLRDLAHMYREMAQVAFRSGGEIRRLGPQGGGSEWVSLFREEGKVLEMIAEAWYPERRPRLLRRATQRGGANGKRAEELGRQQGFRVCGVEDA
jgi:hypothetical protein